MALNDSVTRPCITVDMTLSFGDGVHGRKVTINFLIITCSSAFKGIMGRSFLSKLDEVASPVHLKIIYHDMEGKSNVTSTDLEEARRIKEIIQKNILALSAEVEEGPENINMFDMDIREDEVRPVPTGSSRPSNSATILHDK